MNRYRAQLRTSLFFGTAVVLVAALILVDRLPATGPVHAQASWRGLVVAPEQRCAPYDPDDYRYPQSVEDRIVAELGGVYAPYTGRWFASDSETDIEHVVARSEAHDSGLCAADAATKRRFATDLLNLTLAGPRVNRYEKVDNDAAEWLPTQNRCWYAARIIAVRQQYGLTVDRREADALDRVLSGCASTELVVFARGDVPAAPAAPAAGSSQAIAEWDDNGNGRISCAEARAHGIAPVTRDHPAYPFMRTGMETASSASLEAVVRPPRPLRLVRRRPRPRVVRTATAAPYGAIIPTASVEGTARINAAWTVTTTAGLANAETVLRFPSAHAMDGRTKTKPAGWPADAVAAWHSAVERARQSDRDALPDELAPPEVFSDRRGEFFSCRHSVPSAIVAGDPRPSVDPGCRESVPSGRPGPSHQPRVPSRQRLRCALERPARRLPGPTVAGRLPLPRGEVDAACGWRTRPDSGSCDPFSGQNDGPDGAGRQKDRVRPGVTGTDASVAGVAPA